MGSLESAYNRAIARQRIVQTATSQRRSQRMWRASERVRSSRCSRCQLCRLSRRPSRNLFDRSIEHRPPVGFGIFVEQREHCGCLLGFALRKVIARFVVRTLDDKGVRGSEVKRLQERPLLILLLLVRRFQLRLGPLPRLFESLDGLLRLV